MSRNIPSLDFISNDVVYRLYKIVLVHKEDLMKQYVCSVCGYVYDREEPFEEQPDDFKCPVCGVSKDKFKLEEVEESHEW